MSDNVGRFKDLRPLKHLKDRYNMARGGVHSPTLTSGTNVSRS